jgi:lysophospholipase L1-like esterase
MSSSKPIGKGQIEDYIADAVTAALALKLSLGAYTGGDAKDLEDQIVAAVTGTKGETLTPSSSAIGGTGVASFIIIEAGTYTNNGGFVLPVNSVGVIARNASNELSFASTAFDLSPYMKITKYGFGSNFQSIGTLNTQATSFIFESKQDTSFLESFNIQSTSNGNVFIKVFTLSEDGLSLIFKREVSSPIVTGYNTVICGDLIVEKGDYVGYYSTVTNKYINAGVSQGTVLFINPSENIQADVLMSNLLRLDNGIEFNIRFNFKKEDTYASLYSELQKNRDDVIKLNSQNEVSKDMLSASSLQYTLGPVDLANVGTGAVEGNVQVIWTEDLSYNVLESISWYARTAGDFRFRIWRNDGDSHFLVKDILIESQTVGLRTFVFPEKIYMGKDYRYGTYALNRVFTFKNQATEGCEFIFGYGNSGNSIVTSGFTLSSAQTVSINLKLSKAFGLGESPNERLEILEPKIVGVPERINEIEIKLKGSEKIFGDEIINQGTNNSSTNHTFIFDEDNTGKILNKVNFYSRKVGSILLKIITQSGATYTFKEEISIPTTMGINNYTLPNPIIIGANEKVGIYEPGGVTTFDIVDSRPYATFRFLIGNLTTTTSSTKDSAVEEININFEFIGGNAIAENKSFIESVKSRVSTLELSTASLFKEIGNNLIDESFYDNALPVKLQNAGSAWTFANRRASASGLGLANGLQSKYPIFSNAKTSSIDFFLTRADAAIGIYTRPTTFDRYGSIAKVTLLTNTLSVYKRWTGATNTLPALQQEKTISFTLELNKPYRLSVRIAKKDLIVTVSDLTSGSSDNITILGGSVGQAEAGFALGKVGAWQVAGTSTVDTIKDVINGTDEPRCMFYGDSITEGYLITADETYSYRALAGLNNKGYISAASGCLSIDVFERVTIELDIFRPKYMHILIGTNDTVKATWIANIDAIHSLIVSKGVIPIIGCIPANTIRPAAIADWNATLLTKGYRAVRYDLATTLNNDGTNTNTSLFLSDGVHPNAAGGLAMYNRLVLDVPELFNN